MPRTVDQWIDDLSRSLRTLPQASRRAAAAELVHGVQELQRAAPRRKWGVRPPGHRSLFRSIRIDREKLQVYTEHPGAEKIDEGGTIRPRGQYLVIPLRRGWFTRSQPTYLIPLSGGRRGVVTAGRGQRLVAILTRSVTLRARHWIAAGTDATTRGGDERIADRLLPVVAP